MGRGWGEGGGARTETDGQQTNRGGSNKSLRGGRECVKTEKLILDQARLRAAGASSHHRAARRAKCLHDPQTKGQGQTQAETTRSKSKSCSRVGVENKGGGLGRRRRRCRRYCCCYTAFKYRLEKRNTKKVDIKKRSFLTALCVLICLLER